MYLFGSMVGATLVALTIFNIPRIGSQTVKALPGSGNH